MRGGWIELVCIFINVGVAQAMHRGICEVCDHVERLNLHPLHQPMGCAELQGSID